MLVNRRVILIKEEVTQGTNSAPAVTDAILVENVAWSHVGARKVERQTIEATFGKRQSLYGGTLMQLTFTMEIKGTGFVDYVANPAPEIDVPIRICGNSAVATVTDFTWTPVSTGQVSATIEFYDDGKLYVLVGCMGDMSGVVKVGDKGMISFTMTGHIESITSTAIPTVTYDSTVPSVYIGASFLVGGFAGIIENITWGFNNTVATPPAPAPPDGYGDVCITNRLVAGSIDPEDVENLATIDFIALWKANTTLALTSGVVGAVAGNRWALTMPAISYDAPSPGDRSGKTTMSLPFDSNRVLGNDEWQLQIT